MLYLLFCLRSCCVPSNYVAKDNLEFHLILSSRMTMISGSFCFYLPSTRIAGEHHHAQLVPSLVEARQALYQQSSILHPWNFSSERLLGAAGPTSPPFRALRVSAMHLAIRFQGVRLKQQVSQAGRQPRAVSSAFHILPP